MTDEDKLSTIFKVEDGFEIIMNPVNRHIFINNTSSLCLELFIDIVDDNKYVIVKLLKKCNGLEGSGTNSMTKLKLFANKFDYIVVIESDDSEIITRDGFEFSIKLLYILSTGITWYNKLEFYEKNEKEYTIVLNEFIQKPINEFKDYLDPPIMTPELIEYLHANYQGKTIQESFKLIFDLVKRDDNTDILRLLSKELYMLGIFGFVQPIQQIIFYNKSKNLYYMPIPMPRFRIQKIAKDGENASTENQTNQKNPHKL